MIVDTDDKNNGTLYVVATPIGNLEDISQRALRTLREVDLIASEDTRHTRKLLSFYDISTPLISCYRENERMQSKEIVERLRQGLNVALVSDAGTPCVSDPGAVLIDKLHEENIQVSVIPGASALTSAISISGMQHKHFLFVGFLPSKKSERRRFLLSQKENESALIFYESPRRVISALEDAAAVMGDRRAFVVRELTKIHEEYFRGSIPDVVEQLKRKASVKGEFVVFLDGSKAAERPEGEDVVEILKWYRDNGAHSLSYSVKKVAKDLGLPKAKIYKEALKIWS